MESIFAFGTIKIFENDLTMMVLESEIILCIFTVHKNEFAFK